MRFPASILVAALALACNPPEYEIARPWVGEADVSLQMHAAGDVFRPAVRIQAGASRRLPLGDVETGSLTTWLAVQGESDAPVSVQVRVTYEGDAKQGPQCRFEWSDPRASNPWRRCRIEISGGSGASLDVLLTGPGGVEGLVASPLLRSRSRPERPPVFVFVIDTLRSNPLSIYRDGPSVGSSLKALARDAIVFERASATSAWTRTSMASFFTGLLPQRHQVYDRLDVLSADLLTLPEILQLNGYTTIAWSTNPNILPIWGFDQGFDAFLDVGASNWRGRAKTDGERVFHDVAGRLAETLEDPTFHYVHLMDPHTPYVPPPRYRESVLKNTALLRTFPSPVSSGQALQGTARAPIAYAAYLGEVADVDAQLGRFLDRLEELEVYDEALVLVLSDHGEEFLEHGGLMHGKTLYEEILHIPVVLKLPGNRDAGRRIATPIDLGDLMPTLLQALAITPPVGLHGRALLEGEIAERPLFAALDLDGVRASAVIHDGWKLIVRGNGRAELYHLDTDPDEHSNVLARHAERAAELRHLLDGLEASAGYGWHVRACGGERDATVTLAAHAGNSTLETRLLEDGDQVVREDMPDAPQPSYRATWRLRPELRRNYAVRDGGDLLALDVDEMILAPPPTEPDTALEVTVNGGVELIFAVGPGPEWLRAQRLSLTPISTAAPPGGGAVDCAAGAEAPPDLAGEAHVRIWYTPAPRTLDAEAVDPALAERLRQLGYAW